MVPLQVASMTGDIARRHLEAWVLEQGYDRPGSIPPEMTFRQWCEELGRKGLKVDGQLFTLDNRPSMHFIYDLIPSSVEEALERTVVMMKCAQVGFTVMEMLATIYLALKLEPLKIGMYLPNQGLAGIKSTVRFMPIMRLVPDAYSRLLTDESATGKRKTGEGNVLTRQVGGSTFYFLWTSGKAMTESLPMDMLSYDEVQEMTLDQMEKTNERLSASRVKFKLMGSTANWPDADIHYWYRRGTQHQFHTRCPACGESHVLDEHFPPREGEPCCIQFNDETDDWAYRCVSCGTWLDDPQHGEWRARVPDAKVTSFHYPQMLSPTISAREIMEAYQNATSLKNFYNRKLGKPFTDPSQVPVTMTHLLACVEAGRRAGITWKTAAKQTFMGVDNMGGFACAVVLERLQDGRMALIHAEQIHGLNPWETLDVLMVRYQVAVCVCEQLPNYDPAKQFAARWPARVFLVSSYTDIADDMLRWGDAVQSQADRKTAAEHRDRYTLSLDQYKMMSWAFGWVTSNKLLFPDPQQLTQTILVKKVPRAVELLREVVWDHFMHTALVTEEDKDQHKMKRMVKKIGIDPHFSFAFMMACAAWCRAYGTGTFILPGSASLPIASAAAAIVDNVPGLPHAVRSALEALPASVCGRCWAFEDGRCTERGLVTGEREPSCAMYLPKNQG